MLRSTNPSLLKTATLRSPKYSNYNIPDIIITKPLSKYSLNDSEKILSHPQPGWADDYENSGKFFSRRTWKSISGSQKKPRWRVNTSQERKFRYSPAIEWLDNPAHWDQMADAVVEIITL